MAEVQRAVDNAEWLEDTDKVVLAMFCSALTAYKFTAGQLAKMTPRANMKALNAHKIQLRRETVLLATAAELGFTASARYKLGLTAARTARARQPAVVPVRNEQRAREIAELLQAAGAIPTIPDAEVVVDEPEPVVEESVPDTEPTTPDESEAEVIFFRNGGAA